MIYNGNRVRSKIILAGKRLAEHQVPTIPRKRCICDSYNSLVNALKLGYTHIEITGIIRMEPDTPMIDIDGRNVLISNHNDGMYPVRGECFLRDVNFRVANGGVLTIDGLELDRRSGWSVVEAGSIMAFKHCVIRDRVISDDGFMAYVGDGSMIVLDGCDILSNGHLGQIYADDGSTALIKRSHVCSTRVYPQKQQHITTHLVKVMDSATCDVLIDGCEFQNVVAPTESCNYLIDGLLNAIGPWSKAYLGVSHCVIEYADVAIHKALHSAISTDVTSKWLLPRGEVRGISEIDISDTMYSGLVILDVEYVLDDRGKRVHGNIKAINPHRDEIDGSRAIMYAEHTLSNLHQPVT